MPNLPALTPTNLAEAIEFSKLLAQSTMVPKEYQRNPANILLAVQWGAELGMPPLQALNGIAVINGKPALYGDALLAMCKGSPVCEDVIEKITGRLEDKTASAVCEARRKGKEPVIRAFSVFDAEKAKLWGKSGPWSDYPLRMLAMRARSWALRDQFADILRGVITVEEAADIPREMKDVTPEVITAELDAFAAAGEAHAEAEAGNAEDIDELLSQARTEALKGTNEFRQWWNHTLDGKQRTALQPHLKALQETARDAKPDRRVPRKRKDDEPTEQQIARQQSMLEAVLGQDEIDKLTAPLDPAPIVEPPDYSVLVLYDAEGGNSQEWCERARKRLAQMDELEAPGLRYTAFRKANMAPLRRLKLDFPQSHQELQQIIAAGEQRQ